MLDTQESFFGAWKFNDDVFIPRAFSLEHQAHGSYGKLADQSKRQKLTLELVESEPRGD